MFPLSPANYLKIVRASGVYDLLITAPFATPWSFLLVRSHLSDINQHLGGAALPEFSPFHVLIACLLGSIVSVWSALRVLHPTRRLGRYDGTARFMFSFWMAWTLWLTGEPVLWLFLVPELLWGLVQWLPISYNSAPTTPASCACTSA